MRCPEIKDLLDPWIDGELGEPERSTFETHVGRCPACARAGDERRALSASLRAAFEKSVDGVEAPPHGRLTDLLASASRTRLLLPARVAGVAAAGLILGALAVAFGMQRATPEETALAERLRDREAAGARAKRLRADAENDLAFVRTAVEPERRADPAALAVGVALSTLERRLGPPGPPPPGAPAPRVAVSNTVEGALVELVQMSDGRVTLTVAGKQVEAPSMGELLRRHGELCRRYAVDGAEGRVRVGENAASVDLKGRLELLWRTGRWDEDVQWEAYRAWMAPRSKDAAEMERGLKELQERCRRAAEAAVPPPVKLELKNALKTVKGLSRPELDDLRRGLEAELRRLEAELRDLEELRGRAKGLRAFAEGVK
jgi:hypothetical protein